MFGGLGRGRVQGAGPRPVVQKARGCWTKADKEKEDAKKTATTVQETRSRSRMARWAAAAEQRNSHFVFFASFFGGCAAACRSSCMVWGSSSSTISRQQAAAMLRHWPVDAATSATLTGALSHGKWSMHPPRSLHACCRQVQGSGCAHTAERSRGVRQQSNGNCRPAVAQGPLRLQPCLNWAIGHSPSAPCYARTACPPGRRRPPGRR